MKTSRNALWICAAIIATTGAAFGDGKAADHITINNTIEQDLYTAAETIEVNATIDGDLVSASQTLTVSSSINGDVIAIGESLNFNAAVLDDLRTAGLLVMITDQVKGHVLAAGETVHLSESAQVTDWAWLAGREVKVLGSVGDDVRIVGQNVTIAGDIDGDVTVYAEDVTITSSVNINGDLIVHATNEPEIGGDAIVSGEFRYEKTEQIDMDFGSNIKGSLFASALSLTTLLVVFFLFPQTFKTSAAEIRNVPLKSLGLGFAALILVPILAVLLMVTGIGFALGGLLILAYVLLLVLASVTGYAFLAGTGINWLKRESPNTAALWLVAIIVAFVAMLVIQLVPLLGGLAAFVLLLVGLGGFVSSSWQRYRGITD
jgi:cytoskeletal protein CcmA (bactofilin family)